jgi:hypothetical protein
MRRLLAIYMTFVLVAGPSLCCCATSFATPPSAAPAQPPSPTPSCCKDDRPQKIHYPASDGTPTQQAPKPGQHECPCKDKGTLQTHDQPTPPLTADEVARLLTVTIQLAPVVFTVGPVVDLESACGSPLSSYRLTSWRLLQAHHLLRC